MDVAGLKTAPSVLPASGIVVIEDFAIGGAQVYHRGRSAAACSKQNVILRIDRAGPPTPLMLSPSGLVAGDGHRAFVSITAIFALSETST